MANSKVKVEDHVNEFLSQHDRALKGAIARIAKDILRLSQQRVPRKEGTLWSSGQVEKGTGDLEVYVSYGNDGSKASDYAAVQERGFSSRSGQFRNYTTVGSGPNYLKDAGDRIESQSFAYIDQELKKIKGRR